MMISADQVEDEVPVYGSNGERYCFVYISLVKRLLMKELSAEWRLQFLEWLEKEAREFGADVVTTIQPMCDDGYEIVKEAQKLGAKKTLDVFAQRDVFRAFCTLNPSLVEAIKNANPYLRNGV
jgi:hypothetical protein